MRSFFVSAIALVSILGGAGACHAQTDLGQTSYLDRILRTEDSGADRERIFEQGLRPEGREESFWNPLILDVGFQYSRIDTNFATHNDDDVYETLGELTASTRTGFQLIGGIGYSHDDSDGINSHSEANSGSLTVHPSQQLLPLFLHDAPTTTGIVVGMLTGYRYSHVDIGFGGDVDVNSLILVPNLVFWHYFNSRVTLSEIAAFPFQTSRVDYDFAGDDDTSYGFFSLQTRLDISGPEVPNGHLLFIPSAEWRHDLVVDKFMPEDDWAEFAAKIRWPLPRHGGVVLQYAVDTLRVDYTTHKAMLAVEWEL